MAGSARFVTVVVPIYLVMGNLLAQIKALAAGAVLCFSALILGLYAALFAAWYRFF